MNIFCLQTIIDHADLSEQTIIFLRHAEKETCSAKNDHELNITQAGIAASNALGAYLQQTIKFVSKIKTSPVKRCLQTAKVLQACFTHADLFIQSTNILGDPGPYIEDDKAAMSMFKKQYVYDIVKKQLDYRPMPGFRRIDLGTKLLADEIINDLNFTNYPIIYISHDVIIAAFLGSLINNLSLNADFWIQYLSGFCITKTKEKFILHVVNQHYDISELFNAKS